MWRVLLRAGWEIGRYHTARIMKLAGVKRGSSRSSFHHNMQRAALLIRALYWSSVISTLQHPIAYGWRILPMFAPAPALLTPHSSLTFLEAKSLAGLPAQRLAFEALPLGALEQAIGTARENLAGLIHHSDRRSQHVSLRYGKKLAAHGLFSSTSTVGDSYDNALAETVNGVYKAELVHRQSWNTQTDIEFATSEVGALVEHHTVARVTRLPHARGNYHHVLT